MFVWGLAAMRGLSHPLGKVVNDRIELAALGAGCEIERHPVLEHRVGEVNDVVD